MEHWWTMFGEDEEVEEQVGVKLAELTISASVRLTCQGRQSHLLHPTLTLAGISVRNDERVSAN